MTDKLTLEQIPNARFKVGDHVRVAEYIEGHPQPWHMFDPDLVGVVLTVEWDDEYEDQPPSWFYRVREETAKGNGLIQWINEFHMRAHNTEPDTEDFFDE